MSPEEWAYDFRQAIAKMKEDGVDIWIENGCCGCSEKMSIFIGDSDQVQEVVFDES